MMKKVISWLLLISLTATAAIGGTLAYLTDRDSEANVFTVGDVEIDLTEDFEQGAELIPGVDIEKKPTITNIGENTAWVWAEIAIPAVLDSANDASKNVVHFNYSEESVADGLWNWKGNGDWMLQEKVEINDDGVEYNVYTILYETALKPGETTAQPVMEKVYMDPHVDIDPDGNWAWVENGVATDLGWNSNENGAPTIYVSAYAIQAEGFANAYAAYEAYQTQWGDNGKEWGDPSAALADTWDGTADFALFSLNPACFDDEGNFDAAAFNPDAYEPADELVIDTAEELAAFAKLVDAGETFEGKTVKLGKNIDLNAVDADGNKINFNPIGHSSNGKSFNGIFNGQGYEIQNLYLQNDLGAWQYEGEYYALFAYTNGAEIKNLTVADAYISSGRNEAAGVVGNAVDTKFSDIVIENTTLIAYNNSAGGVASECYGDCSFTNVTVDEDTVIGPLWGTYDVRLGGVVGMVKSNDKVSFSNVTVACKLDAINDVAANYQYWLYRYSGMLIGHVDSVNGVADPTGYVTCENVTVTYGDWVNYHYCEDADLGAGSYNGPGEYKYARVEAGTGTDGIDLSACEHNEDESHNVLIVFDQLFGGGQGVAGLKTYEGVTVIYNNK